ncbi:hypothetical protein DTL21_06235 [Bremerella cremea]|uniref:Uncharacterized protein n=2 Tax=Pirellulales TaxID=2691354 RepID=A0A2S8FZP9_9BACT|nr:hypothetical protein C5Y83_06235 [Blastopirellula marina]RCS49927.1 hypothetical protein DTL21_06235 [Bremerella cremea]
MDLSHQQLLTADKQVFSRTEFPGVFLKFSKTFSGRIIAIKRQQTVRDVRFHDQTGRSRIVPRDPDQKFIEGEGLNFSFNQTEKIDVVILRRDMQIVIVTDFAIRTDTIDDELVKLMWVEKVFPDNLCSLGPTALVD